MRKRLKCGGGSGVGEGGRGGEGSVFLEPGEEDAAAAAALVCSALTWPLTFTTQRL